MAGIDKTTSNASVPLETERAPGTLGDGSHRSTTTAPHGASNELWAGLPERRKRSAEPNAPDKPSKRIHSSRSEKIFPFHLPTELRYEVIKHLEPQDMLNVISACDDWELPVTTSPKFKAIVKDIVEHLQSGLHISPFFPDETRIRNFRDLFTLMQKDDVKNIVNLSLISGGVFDIVPIAVRRFPDMAAEIAEEISRLEEGFPSATSLKQLRVRPLTVRILLILGGIGAGAADEAYNPFTKLLNSKNRVADKYIATVVASVRPNLPKKARDDVDSFLSPQALDKLLWDSPSDREDN